MDTQKVKADHLSRSSATGQNCHPDCGEITERADGMHAHVNEDGRCWHEDDPEVLYLIQEQE